MNDPRPDYLVQGEAARLFPVLSNTSKEGRTTSIVLACLVQIEEFGADMLWSVGQRRGKRANLQTYTEVVFKNQTGEVKDRPDGMIVLTKGAKQWRALVEAKVGNNDLQPEQIERYRVLAKENDIDCVITISNQFATMPSTHPLDEIRKSRSKIPVLHWSWMYILTTAELMIGRDDIGDKDQLHLLNELRRFLSHESAGVQGFDRMPREWNEINKLVSSGGVISAKSAAAQTVISAWHQETRDLSLILSRMTEAPVSEKLPRSHVKDAVLRQKDELIDLRDDRQLNCHLQITGAAAPIHIVADLQRRCLDIGMTLKAPEDKQSTKARLNWLLRQLKAENLDDFYIRLLWPGASDPTQHSVDELRQNIDICNEGKQHVVARAFHVFLSKRTAARFTQRANFISDLETFVPEFYGKVGSVLVNWKKPAPKFKQEKPTADDVTRESIADDAETYDG